MGITSWTASGVLGKGGPPAEGQELSGWMCLELIVVFIIAPLVAIAAILWISITAPPQDTSWCARWVAGHCAERAHQPEGAHIP